MILPDLALLRRRRDLRLLVGGYAVSPIGGAFTQVALTIQVYDLTGSTLAVGLLGAARVHPDRRAGADRRRAGGRLRPPQADLRGGARVGVRVRRAAGQRAACRRRSCGCSTSRRRCSPRASAVLRPPLDALLPRLVERDELKAATAISWSLMSVVRDRRAGARGLGDRRRGRAVRVRDRRRDVLRLAERVRAHAHASAAPGRGPAEPARRGRGRQVRVVAPGDPRLLRDRHERDVLRDAVRAVPGRGGAVRRGRGGRAAVGRARRWARSWPCSRAGGACACTTTAARSCSRPPAGARSIALFGLADSLWLALVALAFAGAADAISGIFRGALWNETIPDRLRGRLAGLEMISWSSGPLLGNARAGRRGVAVRPRAVDRDRRRAGRRGVRRARGRCCRASGTTTRGREAGARPRR